MDDPDAGSATVPDAELVAAMVAGDPRGLEGAYRAYAAPLFAYCRRLLSDPDAAADAVQDTFVLAGQRAGQLRDPQRLRAWLYAIARNECVRQVRAGSRHVPLERAGNVSAPTTDPGRAVHADQVRELVWAAAAALSEGDRHVFELMVRHGLSAAEVGAVLGVSVDNAHARLSRARAQLERALGVLVVARGGGGECAELAGLVRGWDGTLNALLRKRIGRHVDGCAVCGDRRRRELQPATLLAAYAGLPFLAVPAGLFARIQNRLGGPPSPMSLDSNGFPPTTPAAAAPMGPDGPTAQVRRQVLLTVAGVVVLLVLGGLLVPVLLKPDGLDLATPPTSATGSTTPAVSGPPAPAGTSAAAPGANPGLTPGGGAGPGGPVQPPTTPAAPTLVATGVVAPNGCPRYLIAITATVTGSDILTATLYWAFSGGATMSKPMTVTGNVAKGAATNLIDTPVTWWVLVVTTGHQTLLSEKKTFGKPCP